MQLENILVECHEIFAKHCFDVGYNTEIRNKIMLDQPLPVYVQGPPGPINLRDETLIKFALLQYVKIITTLS